MNELLRCVIIDDEPLGVALLKSYIEASANLHLIGDFEDAIAASEFINRNKVDLLFLDINMPDISGIDLYQSLENKPMVIFATAYKQFAYEGFELNAIDYLLKPIAYARFKKAVTKAFDYHQQQLRSTTETKDCIFVYSEYKLVKVMLKNILYLESLEDYVKIHFTDGTIVLTLMPLKKMIEKLPESGFKRIHRSFVIPLEKVTEVVNRKVKLVEGTLLPISDSYADFIKLWQR